MKVGEENPSHGGAERNKSCVVCEEFSMGPREEKPLKNGSCSNSSACAF